MEPTLIAALLVLGAAIGFAPACSHRRRHADGAVHDPAVHHAEVPPEHIVHMAIATRWRRSCSLDLLGAGAPQARRGAVAVAASSHPGSWSARSSAPSSRRLPSRYLAMFFALFVGFSATQMLLDRKPSRTVSCLAPPECSAPAGRSAWSRRSSAPRRLSRCVHALVQRAHAQRGGHLGVAGLSIAAAGTIGYVISGWHLTGITPGVVATSTCRRSSPGHRQRADRRWAPGSRTRSTRGA